MSESKSYTAEQVQCEQEAFERDVSLFGVGFLVDGVRVSPDRVVMQYAATRPEQQPVSWQFYQSGKWWNGDDRIKDYRKNTEAAGIPVRDLYAAPIAQTAPKQENDHG